MAKLGRSSSWDERKGEAEKWQEVDFEVKDFMRVERSCAGPQELADASNVYQ